MKKPSEHTTKTAAIVWRQLELGAILRSTGKMYRLDDATAGCTVKRVSPGLVAFMLERYFKDEKQGVVTMTLDRDSRPNTFTPYAGLTAAMYKQELLGVQAIEYSHKTAPAPEPAPREEKPTMQQQERFAGLELAEQLAAGYVRCYQDLDDPEMYGVHYHEYTVHEAAQKYPALTGKYTKAAIIHAVQCAVSLYHARIRLECAADVHTRVLAAQDPLDVNAFFARQNILRCVAVRTTAIAKEVKQDPRSVKLTLEIDEITLARLEQTMEFDCSSIQDHAEGLLYEAAKALYDENELARELAIA